VITRSHNYTIRRSAELLETIRPDDEDGFYAIKRLQRELANLADLADVKLDKDELDYAVILLDEFGLILESNKYILEAMKIRSIGNSLKGTQSKC
jgi:hypothetical protein